MIRPADRGASQLVRLEILAVQAQRAARALKTVQITLYPGTRRTRWAQQYPVYTCPSESELWSLTEVRTVRCGRTWDRRTTSTPDLRMEVWEHVLSVHDLGDPEAARRYADQVTEQIMEGP